MAIKNYIATVSTSGIPRFMEKLVEEEFVSLYSKFAETSAKFFAVKNAEYDRLSKDNPTLNYDQWMSKEMQKELQTYISLLIDLQVDEECQIYGRFKYGDGTVRFNFSEAN